VFPNAAYVISLVDRLLHNAEIIGLLSATDRRCFAQHGFALAVWPSRHNVDGVIVKVHSH